MRELGTSAIPTWAALEALPGGSRRLVVVERVSRGKGISDPEIAEWVRNSERLATLEHPNVVRVRDVVSRKDDVSVVNDYVDGVRWAEVATAQTAVPLEMALRVLVDALSGLSAIHNVRAADRGPLKLVHGALTPEYVLVGSDGVSRIMAASRVRSAAQSAHVGSAYLAPEVLLADDTADARADVYSIGVMLWEALSGRPLFSNTQPSAIVTALLSGRVPRADAPPGAPWAAPLVDVVSRSLSVDPDKRFASASAMATELRRVAGVKLVPSLRVAALIRDRFGERIKTRREELERGETARRGADRAAFEEIPVDLMGPSSSIPAPAPSPLTTTRPPPPLAPATSSEPPTQPRIRAAAGLTEEQPAPAAIAVPPAPQVPRDLVATTDAPIVVPTPFVAYPPPAAAIEVETGPPVTRPRLPRAVLFAAAPLVVALAALAWWLWLGASAPIQTPTTASSASAASPPLPVVTASTVSEPAQPPATAAPVPPESASSLTEATKEGIAAPSATASATPPLPAPAKAKPRAPTIKYDPQGI